MTGMDAIRMAAPYLSRFRSQVFVLKIGGDVLASESSLRSTCEQVALLWALGIRIVLIHGGGPSVDQLSEQLGLQVEKVEGRRVTDAKMLEAVKMTLGGTVNLSVVGMLRRVGLRPVGLTGMDGGIIVAKRRPPVQIAGKEVDFGLVGDIQSVDTELIFDLLESGFLPVIAPLTADTKGQVLNTNADTVAASIAQEMGAEKLVYILKVPGLLRNASDPNSLIPMIKLGDLKTMMATDAISGGMKPKLQSAVAALEGGVSNVHLVSGLSNDALLMEIFTNEGSGTMIRGDDSA